MPLDILGASFILIQGHASYVATITRTHLFSKDLDFQIYCKSLRISGPPLIFTAEKVGQYIVDQ